MKRKLQVFVSSTYTDLIKERQAAVEAILRAGHIPAGMELFAAGSESQLEIVKRWIDDSDVYMLLLGGRYGSLESKSGLSYTEIEYRYAVEQDKPVFAVILSQEFVNDKVKSAGREVLEINEYAKYSAFVELVKQRISRFVNNESEIRLAVLESILDIQSRYTLTGWVRGEEVPNVNELINQISELKETNAALSGQLVVYNSAKNDKIGEFTYEELKGILKAIKVKIPVSITKSTIMESNVFDIILFAQPDLSAGVNNRLGASELDRFLYYDVCPYLRIYDLAEISKVSNAQWTTFQTSKLGNRLLALANQKDERKEILSVDNIEPNREEE